MKMSSKKFIATTVAVASLVAMPSAFAQSNAALDNTSAQNFIKGAWNKLEKLDHDFQQFRKSHLNGFYRRISGKITALNGNTITVQNIAGKTFTVDASSATVKVDQNSGSLSDLAVGDQVLVRGTHSASDNTQITATNILKNTKPMQPRSGAMRGGAFGKITAVNGSSITVQGPAGKTFTIDASSATVKVDQNSGSLSDLAVGDQVLVRGTPSSTDSGQITAQNIIKITKPIADLKKVGRRIMRHHRNPQAQNANTQTSTNS